MGQKLSPQDLELYRRCDEVMHYLWDPIGVSEVPEARDEYEDYLPQVFALVRDRSEPDKVAEYLLHVEIEMMGMPGSRDRAIETARILTHWREVIEERAA